MDQGLAEKIAAAAESLGISLDEWSVAEAVLVLLRERRDWKKLERAHRLLLRDLVQSKATEIGGLSRDAREAWLWRGLAAVINDGTRDDAAELESRENAWRVSKALVDALALADLHERARRFEQALTILEQLVSADPTQALYHERMFEILASREDPDRAFCTAAALVMLGSEQKSVRLFYENHAPRARNATLATLSADDWAKLRDPKDDPLLDEVFRWAAPAAFAKEVACTVRDDEATAKARAALVQQFPELALLHLSLAQLKLVFFAAMRSQKRKVEIPGGFEGPVASAIALMAKHHTPLSESRLRVATAAIVVNGAAADVARWRRSSARTLLRAAVLFARDPCCLEHVGDDDDVLGGTRLGVAIAFTTSRLHAELRKRLGAALPVSAVPAPGDGYRTYDRAELVKLFSDFDAREAIVDADTPIAQFLRRMGAYFRPTYQETQYTDWNGSPTGTGPGGVELRAAIPPDPSLAYGGFSVLLGLGPFARELVARHPSTPDRVLEGLAMDADATVARAVAERADKSAELWEKLASSPHVGARWRLAQEPKLAHAQMLTLARDADDLVRSAIVERADVTDDVLRVVLERSGGAAAFKVAKSGRASAALLGELLPKLADESNSDVRRFVASHRLTSPETLARMAAMPDAGGVHELVAAHAQTPVEALRLLFPEVPARVAAHPKLPADLAEVCARHAKHDVRVALAGNRDADPSALGLLIEDPSIYVRLALADNPAFRMLVDLATDPSADVRYRVARRSDAPDEVLLALRRESDRRIRKEAVDQLKARASNRTDPEDEIDRMIGQLSNVDPSTRVEAAEWLGAHGDARALEPLDDVVYLDTGTIEVEVGNVDRIVPVADRAKSALADLLDRLPLETVDVARYRRHMRWPTGANVPGPVRSSAEMNFFASLQPCAKCGTLSRTGFLTYGEQRKGCWLWGKCQGCGVGLHFGFTRDSTFDASHPYLELGGPEPSRVITTEQFARELDRLTAEIRFDVPDPIPDDGWSAQYDRIERAMTCLLELGKFATSDQPSDLVARRANVEAVRERYIADRQRRNSAPRPEAPRAVTPVVAKPPAPVARPPSAVSELIARKLAQAAAELAEAEREALASGKEPLDCAALRKLADCGNASDKELRNAYYVGHPEIRTMAEYAAFLAESAPWQDSN